MAFESSVQVDETLPARGVAGGACDELFAGLDELELTVVSRAVASAERMQVVWLARVISRLGNGWIYPPLALALVATDWIEAPLRFLASAALSVLITFAGYPSLKRFLSRRRPCDYDRTLLRGLFPLDHYSCPSGHTMMAASFSVTVLVASPAVAVIALALTTLMGWSRIALGHHYATDVVAGAILGAAVAAPIAALVM